MPTPKHFRFVFRGIFANTAEEWSFGVKGERMLTGEPDLELSNVHFDQLVTALTTLLQSGHFGSNLRATEIRGYKIAEDGRMSGNPHIEVLPPNTIAGTLEPKYPPQISLAITTVAENRGPARLGRFYMPGIATAIGADMRISAGAAGNLADAGTAFLKSVSDAIDIPGDLDLGDVAMVNVSNGNGGTIQRIHHVEVGRVLDTLRSRRNKLVDERIAAQPISW